MPLFNFYFVVTYIIHKMLILPKNQLNCFKDSIFECLFKDHSKLFFFFSWHVIMENLSLEEVNIIKDIRNLLRLKNELNYTAIKDIRKTTKRN